ncbi:c-type cytochrome [Algoriphagus namhaensis]|uniref:C-type cytochrome n=1 Tax=Algoriphagus namhaensis TaxID=915353 RepID=A0ABV8ASD2_9BACT
MKSLSRILYAMVLGLLISCGGGESGNTSSQATTEVDNSQSDVPASQRITLDEKGVGPIQNLILDPEIDPEMVASGAAMFKTNCSACHKTDKRFIGPNPTGIMKRRSPEWIMNMILEPQLMVEEDQCAKDLLIEFNGAAMANQNMTEEQARDILEYFRTLE